MFGGMAMKRMLAKLLLLMDGNQETRYEGFLPKCPLITYLSVNQAEFNKNGLPSQSIQPNQLKKKARPKKKAKGEPHSSPSPLIPKNPIVLAAYAVSFQSLFRSYSYNTLPSLKQHSYV